MLKVFKWITFGTIFFTTILIPAFLLESSFTKLGEVALSWSQDNSFYISLVVIIALTLDVFLPVPNGLTNTLAGVALGWSLASLVVWIGLTLGAIFGYLVGRIAARPLAIKMVGELDFSNAEKAAERIDIEGLILARPVPAFAELSTLAAGLTKMPFKKFMIVIALSNIGVAVIFSGLGAAALSAQSSLIGFVGAAILPAVLYWIYKRFRA
jgi:uncharacterized membrane protein YdjX (TVP38/TMEM64 family)